MARVIVAVVLTAVVQFVWGFTYFGVLNGMDRMTSRAPEEAALAETLAKALPSSGTYILPTCPGMSASPEVQKAHEARVAAGPIVSIHIRKEGFDLAQVPAFMGMGFGLTLLTAAVAALLLQAALPGLRTYAARLGFVTGLGVLATLTTRLSDGLWLHYPAAFVIGQSLFGVTVWLLGGAVMAAIIRPSAAQQQAAEPSRPTLAA
jgi:hypothetical protein